jgi:sec-independent protein translocase protein TatA
MKMSPVFGFIPSIGPTELVLVLFLALIIFGPGKLTGVGKALGQSIREFRSATKEDEQEKVTKEA